MKKILLLSALFFSALFSYSEPIKVFVALHDIPALSVITGQDIATAVPAIAERDAFFSEQDIALIEGAVALVNIPKGTQIKKNSLKLKDKKPSSSELNKGWGYYILPVDIQTADMVLSNGGSRERVDLIVRTYREIGDLNEPVVFTLLQNIEVKDVLENNGAYSLLLITDPADAQLLFLTEKKDAFVKVLLRAETDIGLHNISVTQTKNIIAKKGE
ncbi:SAF domain protein [Elusimicrobium minutum Pei191]|uniref:SAF domain protein n=1 Tax=Elusimicrobium minutum (strain Pei191) TaxID=445932 RepID=B2KEB9_ELUMP|nr:SAF domain-containing protein [Elusimicrobium minutum]ACC98865.1 SAF domain protein [Elusimicrobium minutum Pei191]